MVESSDNNLSELDSSVDDGSTKCPMCGEPVPANAIECPSCVEPFSPEAFETAREDERKSKFLFWAGLILVIVGGPGVALGSWLHDWLQIPIADYDNFDSFGWANKLVSSVGIIILVIGIIMLILSLPKLREESIEDEELIEDTGINVTGDQGG